IGGGVLCSTIMYLATAEAVARNHKISNILRESSTLAEAAMRPTQQCCRRERFNNKPQVVDTLKDRWNTELQNLYTSTEFLDFTRLREQVEATIGQLQYRRGRQD
ncbi:hypothetical protein EDC01DRAFT_618414, partial [Geopyxis carbonaria]